MISHYCSWFMYLRVDQGSNTLRKCFECSLAIVHKEVLCMFSLFWAHFVGLRVKEEEEKERKKAQAFWSFSLSIGSICVSLLNYMRCVIGYQFLSLCFGGLNPSRYWLPIGQDGMRLVGPIETNDLRVV